MIRIVLLGRTGNNLFQYALGRVLAKKHGVPLVLDASWFDATGWREVSHFLKLPIQAKVTRKWTLASRALRKFTGRHPWQGRSFPFISEPTNHHVYDPRFLDVPADCALFGYFQSWRYFASIEDELRSELKHLLELDFINAPDSLRAPGSVAVHVRRGDFLHHPAFQVCDNTYYRNAMDEMRLQVNAPRFFVFSDDPDWCRREMVGDDIEIIDSGCSGTNPLHDLRLMSFASHHIIANSSYSWWAAWLGRKESQIVLAPPRWYTKDITAPISEKLCQGWATVGTEPPGGSRE